MITGLPSRPSASKPKPPFTRQTRVVTVSPGNSGAEKRTREPANGTRIVDAGSREHRAAGERHRAETVDDPPREADLLREPVVGVDREVVSRRSGVANGLILSAPASEHAR